LHPGEDLLDGLFDGQHAPRPNIDHPLPVGSGGCAGWPRPRRARVEWSDQACPPVVRSMPVSTGGWQPTGQTWLEASEEPTSAQQEEGEEAGRDEKIAPGKGQAASAAGGREHDEDTLKKYGAEPHRRQEEDRGVSVGLAVVYAIEHVAAESRP